MSKRQSLVAANWKMNGTLASMKPLVEAIKAGLESCDAEVAICAPYIYLAELSQSLAGTALRTGAERIVA